MCIDKIIDLKEAIVRKLSIVQFLEDIVNKTLGEVKELTNQRELTWDQLTKKPT